MGWRRDIDAFAHIMYIPSQVRRISATPTPRNRRLFIEDATFSPSSKSYIQCHGSCGVNDLIEVQLSHVSSADYS